MGLDVYLLDGAKYNIDSDENEDDGYMDAYIEDPSDKYPEHGWNKGYLRSSYNDGGYNRVVGNLISKDLYYVFAPVLDANDDSYQLRPTKEQLKECLERAQETLKELKVARPLGILSVHKNPFVDIMKDKPDEITKEDVINLVNKEYEKHSNSQFGSYSNAKGDFFLNEPLKVVALIPGREELFNRDAVFAVYETDLKYYLEASEVLIEFIEKALTLEVPIIHWSS